MQTLEQNKDIVLKCLRKERDKIETWVFNDSPKCVIGTETEEEIKEATIQELESINWGIRIIIATH